MSNPIKDKFDEESIIKDIKEREHIIDNYQRCSLLDRDNAIKKIQKLRISDEDILITTSVKFAISSTTFSQSINDQIIDELIMQRNIFSIMFKEF